MEVPPNPWVKFYRNKRREISENCRQNQVYFLFDFPTIFHLAFQLDPLHIIRLCTPEPIRVLCIRTAIRRPAANGVLLGSIAKHSLSKSREHKFCLDRDSFTAVMMALCLAAKRRIYHDLLHLTLLTRTKMILHKGHKQRISTPLPPHVVISV